MRTSRCFVSCLSVNEEETEYPSDLLVSLIFSRCTNLPTVQILLLFIWTSRFMEYFFLLSEFSIALHLLLYIIF
ncbi:hypothetical protein NERG_01555 [Nematocida ausubeli]|uniref:Uncharacterized protein n=1 Tax=Nematocida ausubeli (strain ATCC PRA-371 / ERTm2) TaxID=1913371 RepID=H8ZD84_NEMA1|nr:hypothetical protein NERG_01555 [Nematocida ausubeli]